MWVARPSHVSGLSTIEAPLSQELAAPVIMSISATPGAQPFPPSRLGLPLSGFIPLLESLLNPMQFSGSLFLFSNTVQVCCRWRVMVLCPELLEVITYCCLALSPKCLQMHQHMKPRKFSPSVGLVHFGWLLCGWAVCHLRGCMLTCASAILAQSSALV